MNEKRYTQFSHVYPYNAETFFMNHGDQRVFQFDIIINVINHKLVLPASFEYLCHGSTAIIN